MPESTPYDARFFDAQSRRSFESAERVLACLFALHRPQSLLDVGCGVGAWLAAARAQGVADVLGVDGDYVPRDRLLVPEACFLAHDLAAPLDLRRRFDLVCCLEVAEHLAAGEADTLVDSLTRHGDLVLFSAAAPYQGGVSHRHENWLEFWAQAFAKRGYEALDVLRERIWADDGIDWWYRQNVMLFRASAARVLPDLRAAPAQSRLHPEFLLRLVRRTPRAPVPGDLAADLEHYHRLAQGLPVGAAPPYGATFDFQTPPRPPVVSYDDLKRLAAALDNPLLSDALAPILPRRPPLAPLPQALTPPDFLCVGVQKAATTWLYEATKTHSAFRPPPVKALNFFNRRAFAPGSAYQHSDLQKRAEATIRAHARNAAALNPNWLRALTHLFQPELTAEWYEGVFRLPPDTGKLRGDFTPEYAMLPDEGVEEIARFAPDLRILLLLRDPVERIVSQVGAIVRQVPEAAPFADRLAREPSVVARSRYDLIVPRWRRHFPPKRLLIAAKPESAVGALVVLTHIAHCLGIDPEGFSPEIAERLVDAGEDKPALSAQTLDFLSQELAESRRLYEAIAVERF